MRPDALPSSVAFAVSRLPIRALPVAVLDVDVAPPVDLPLAYSSGAFVGYSLVQVQLAKSHHVVQLTTKPIHTSN